MGRQGRTRRRSFITILAALSLLGSLAAPGDAYSRPEQTLLVSVTSAGEQASSDQGPGSSGIPYYMPAISDDGRFVAFVSDSPKLPDATGQSQIYRHDRITGKTELASVTSHGLPNNTCPSLWPAISANGRYVAFWSCMAFLSSLVKVAPDAALLPDVYVHDMRTGKTVQADVSSEGDRAIPITAGFLGGPPSISADGRYVAFSSDAPNLVSGDTNSTYDIFIHDLNKKTTERVSVDAQGRQANGSSMNPSLSASGRYVVFNTNASNLVPGTLENFRGCPWQSPGSYAVVRDGVTGKLEHVALNSDGSVSSGLNPQISANGRHVAYAYWGCTRHVPNDADTLIPGSEDGSDAYVFDRQTRRTERVSVSSWGGQGNALSGSDGLGISSEGRHVVFSSHSSSWFPGDEDGSSTEVPGLPGGDPDVFVFDRRMGSLDWVSVGYEGGDNSGGWSFGRSISRAGRHVAFWSDASDLIRGDNNETFDAFLRDRGPTLGFGGFGASSSPKSGSPDDRICITSDTCIPPGTSVSASDATGDLNGVLTQQGANLYGASLAYRPQHDDLYAGIELEHMPKVIPGLSPIFYGLRFEVENKRYEVRATSLNYGTFGLFDCTGSTVCTLVADLQGGYGTTGERVVFSLPLDEVGLEEGGKLKDVVAFSELGTYLAGATKVLDSLKLK